MRPSALAVSSAARCTATASVTSTVTLCGASALASAAASRSHRLTRAPSAASRAAMPAPMPDTPPVTMATRFANRDAMKPPFQSLIAYQRPSRHGPQAMTRYIGAIDQGTTSTRFIVFDRAGDTIAVAQNEHRQIYPMPGWVEHDPVEIWRNTQAVIGEALRGAGLTRRDLAAVGITNQRETTLLWDRATGQPLHNAVVWQDTRVDPMVAEYARDGGQDRFRAKTGLPLTSYFSALKLRWLLDNVPDARRRAEAGDLLFGTIDSWLLWNFTGLHLTDVTNASRTQLMDLHTLKWDDALLGDVRRFRARSCRPSCRPRPSMALRPGNWMACRSAASWATSRPPWWGRPACIPARRRAPTAPAASC